MKILLPITDSFGKILLWPFLMPKMLLAQWIVVRELKLFHGEIELPWTLDYPASEYSSLRKAVGPVADQRSHADEYVQPSPAMVIEISQFIKS